MLSVSVCVCVSTVWSVLCVSVYCLVCAVCKYLLCVYRVYCVSTVSIVWLDSVLLECMCVCCLVVCAGYFLGLGAYLAFGLGAYVDPGVLCVCVACMFVKSIYACDDCLSI